MEDARYDISAKVPPQASADEFNLMLQSLLTERIGLVVHHEMREQSVYEMSIAKGGLRMKEAGPLREGEKATAYSANTPEGGFRLVARMTRFSDIVRWWERFAQMPIVDRTGLSGYFDFVLELPPNEPQSQSPDAVPASATPLWFTFPGAVEKQLGLRLDRRKEKADVLVVDRFDKLPSEN